MIISDVTYNTVSVLACIGTALLFFWPAVDGAVFVVRYIWGKVHG